MSSPDKSPPPLSDDGYEYDPIFTSSRREAIIIFCLWAVGLLWAVPYCYLTGYQYDAENFSVTLGIPTWLFWGIFVPWLVADAFTIWFCFCYMKDADLGEAHEGADVAEDIAEMHAGESSGKESN